MKYIKYFHALLLILLTASKVNAQAVYVKQGEELQEIVKISEVYRLAPNLSFNIIYNYRDSIIGAGTTETATGLGKFKEGLFWISVETFETMQGYRYNITQYKDDSVLLVNEPQLANTTLRIPLLDSFFRAANIEGMQITPSNDSTYLLNVTFKNGAPYSGYKLHYDFNKYLIRKIEYYVKDMPVEDGSNASGVQYITITLNNYSLVTINDDVFREDKYIYENNGQVYAKPAYSNYKLIVNTAK